MADKPNILVIWGDDIGITNLSCYSDGLMGYRTPNIDRIADEGMRFTDSYGEQSCTAGRASFITGQSVFRTGLSKVGLPGRAGRAAGRGPDDRRAAQAPRLRDRAVRQEPPRRPERVPADGARLRRVLRQPLPPQRRGGPGGSRTTRDSTASRSSGSGSARAACSAAGRRTRTTRPSSRAGAGSASSGSRTPGPLTRKRMETCDDEFVDAACDFIKRQHDAAQAVLLLGEHDPHAPPHAHQAPRASARPGAGSRPTTTR